MCAGAKADSPTRKVLEFKNLTFVSVFVVVGVHLSVSVCAEDQYCFVPLDRQVLFSDYCFYINDLPLAVQGCSVELYADDTLIYFASKSVSEIQAQL